VAAPFTCPTCKHWIKEVKAERGGIVICSNCGDTLVPTSPGNARKAHGGDIDTLQEADLRELRIVRAGIRGDAIRRHR